jgi:basic amino acid/polyamine antiporter, APA family
MASVTTAEGAFVRKASGLVRAFSPLDFLYYNIFAINPFLVCAFTFTFMVVSFPGAAPWLAVLIIGCLCIPEAIVYALLVSAMPRSGGDYVFQSRVLGGGIATFTTFSGIVLAEILAIVGVGVTAAQIVLSPGITILGAYYNQTWLANLGSWLGTPSGTFVVVLICAAWATAVCIFNLRIYALLQRWTFIPGLIGMVIVLAVVLFSTHDQFVSNLNTFMSDHFGVKDAYNTVLANAGPQPGFSLNATLLAMAFASFSLIFPAWGALQAGEIRQANVVRWNWVAIVGCEITAIVLATLAAALVVSRVGSDFFSAASSLAVATPDKYPLPIPPFVWFFASLMQASPVLYWLVFITGNLWLWMWFPNLTLGASRAALAMSFDGVLPEWVGRVSNRFHTPVLTILAIGVGYLIVSILYLLKVPVTTLTAIFILLSVVTFFFTCLAGALLPYRRPQLFNSAPAGVRVKIAGIPLITIAGVAFLPVAAWIAYRCLFDPALGVNTALPLGTGVVIYALSLAVYGIPAIIRRRRGGLSFKERFQQLPIE